MAFETPTIPRPRRLSLALLLSLLVHTLLLSLTFGGQGRGLPGFGFPWQERRFEAPDLRVVLIPVKVSAAEPTRTLIGEPQQQSTIKPPATNVPTLKPSLALPKIPAPTSAQTPAPMPAQPADTVSPKNTQSDALAPAAKSEPASATDVVAAITPPPIPVPTAIAVERAETATLTVPLPPTPVIAVAQSASRRESMVSAPPTDSAKQEATKEATELEAERLESARTETARLEAATLEAARQKAAQREARRQADKVEAAKVDTEKAEAAKTEATKMEATRQEAARIESTQLDAQRQEIARQASARAEAAREATRLETERQEGVRQDAARIEAARVLAEKEEDAKRDARRQAMGRVLNEEAARRKALETAEAAARSPSTSTSTLPYSLSTARRARLWGRTDSNAELVQYAETWARKIESNTPLETVREVAKRPHTDPMVTVAIRSDGSVESVTFVLSSGVAEIDEAIRQIVQSHASYRAFPPALAREVDVIEVRRTWHFDIGIRLY